MWIITDKIPESCRGTGQRQWEGNNDKREVMVASNAKQKIFTPARTSDLLKEIYQTPSEIFQPGGDELYE